MTNLLIDDSPLKVLLKLAEKIGLNEAIILMQLQDILKQEKTKKVDNKEWIGKSYAEWRKKFPFWSEVTIKRTILSLEKVGIIESDNLNTKKSDNTKWYTINYEKLKEIVDGSIKTANWDN